MPKPTLDEIRMERCVRAVATDAVTQSPEGCRMRLEQKSIIAVTLLLMTGCSASRQALQSENDYNAPEPVPMPMRHADEYDSGENEYDFAPQGGETPSRSDAPVPQPGQMREPVPAPPAIGVSRVKSVGWLRSTTHEQNGDKCSEPACGDGCSQGGPSEVQPGFTGEGCITSQSAIADQHLQCRKRTTLRATIQGWNQRARRRRAERALRSLNCGSEAACDPHCFAPEGCQSTVQENRSCPKSRQAVKQSNSPAEITRRTADTHGNLADPLRENGWDDRASAQDSRFSLDELLELPSSLIETPVNDQQRPGMPNVPMIEALPVLPAPEEVSGQSPQASPAPAAVSQQFSPDTVPHFVQPQLWPRLNPRTASASPLPVALPVVPEDTSLPTILPGRRF